MQHGLKLILILQNYPPPKRLIIKLLCDFIPILILLLKSLIHTEQCHLLDIEGKVNKTFRNHLILSRYLTGKVMRRAEKVASRAVLTPSEGKNKKGKNAVMGQKCTFSTLISVGKVKRIYRKRWEKWTNFRISWEKKCRINKTRIYKKSLLIRL